MTTTTIQVCIMIDDRGEYVVGAMPENCTDAWEDEQESRVPLALATYQIAIELPLPAILEAATAIGAKGGTVNLRLVE